MALRKKGGVLSLMYRRAGSYRNRPALSFKDGDRWCDMSFRQLQQRAKRLSNQLINLGVNRGDRVAILCEPGPAWGIAFFAAVRAGAVVVPLDTGLTASELAAIARDARPQVLFVSHKMAPVGEKLKPSETCVNWLIQQESPDGWSVPTGFADASDAPGRERDLDETAVMVYTSGTTGQPKGVMVSFRTLVFQIDGLEKILESGTGDVFLSILPMNHLLELTGGFLGVLYSGGQICYAPGLYPQDILQAMRERGVTLMFTVPMFLKMLKGSIERELNKLPPGDKKSFDKLYKIASWIPSRRLRRFLFASVLERLGGKARGFICGGAPLDPEVSDFFDRLGVPVYQGYGLTETGPIVSANSTRHYRPGSVGRPLTGVEVRIAAADGHVGGEILTRGPHVFQGYYGQDELTGQAVDADGWFHTGDLGHLDKDGYLHVTGRLKNLIVTGSGKKVQPEEVEAALASSGMVKEVCIAGRSARHGLAGGTEEVCAVAVPAPDLLESCCGDLALAGERIREEFDRLLLETAPYKRPTRIFVRQEPLPRTATQKIRRRDVERWLAEREVAAS